MPISFDWPDDPAYAAFVGEHGQTLLRLAVLLTGNRYDAEDVMQDAVIAVARHWRSLRRETALAYLRTAVTRKAIDLKRRPRASVLDESADRTVAELGYLRLESHAEFVRLLQGLPGRQRAVLVLRYWADLDDAAVAASLGCSVQTVRSQASRALAKLRGRLAGADAADVADVAFPLGGGLDGPR